MKTVDDVYMGIVDHLTDCQMIEVVSRVQNYTHEQTYVYAHQQVGVQGDPWSRWSKGFSLLPSNNLKLPSPVRIELEEVIGRFILEGRLKTEHFAKVLHANMTFEDRQNLYAPPPRSFTSRLVNYAVWFVIFYSIFSILL